MSTRAERRKEWRAKPWWKRWLFASWQDFMLILILFSLLFAYKHDTDAYREVYEDPCAYCQECAVPFTYSLPVFPGNETVNITGWVERDET